MLIQDLFFFIQFALRSNDLHKGVTVSLSLHTFELSMATL